MKGLSRVLPIIGGAIAGGAIALAVANGSTTTHSVTTTTVVQPSNSPTLPTSFSDGHSQTINQIYRAGRSGRRRHHHLVHPEHRRSVRLRSDAEDRGRGRRRRVRQEGRHHHRRARRVRRLVDHRELPRWHEGAGNGRGLGHRCRPGGHPGAWRPRLRASPDPVRRLERGAGGRQRDRDRQPVRRSEHASPPASSARSDARSTRPTSSRSRTRSRPTRRSTPATRAGR